MIIFIAHPVLALFGIGENNIIVNSINLQEGVNINLDPNTITGFGTINLVDEPIIEGNFTINGDLILRDRILSVVDQEINASILPTIDNKFDLGTTILRWKDGFFSGDVKVDGNIFGEIPNAFKNNNFTERYNLILDRFDNENFTIRYDLRTDRWKLANLTEALLKAGTINATKYEESSLVGWWQFNNNANDSSQYGNDGDPEGGVRLEKNVAEFDGVDDKITIIETTYNVNTGANTFMGWYYSLDGDVDFMGNSGSNFNKFINILSNGLMRIEGDTNNDRCEGDFGTTPTNSWNHFTIVVDGGVCTFYHNGVIFALSDSSIDSDITLDTIGLAGDGTFNYNNGTLDEVKIYSRALTSAEIQRNYNEENKNYGHFNNIDVKDLNVTNTLNIEGESTFKDNIHLKDNKKFYFGDADDVSVEFDENNLVWLAEVGSPNFIIDGMNLNVTGDILFGGRDIIDTVSTTGIIRLRGTNVNRFLELTMGSVQTILEAKGSGAVGTHFFRFKIEGDEKMTIKETGEVGIGTTTPTSKLHVIGDINATGNITSGNSTIILDGNNNVIKLGEISFDGADSLTISNENPIEITVQILGSLNVSTNLTVNELLILPNIIQLPASQSTFIVRDDESGVVGTKFGVRNTIPSTDTDSGVSYILDVGSGNNMSLDLHSSLDPDNPLTVVSHYNNDVKGHVWRLNPDNDNAFFRWEVGKANGTFMINQSGRITFGNPDVPLNISGYNKAGQLGHCGMDDNFVWSCSAD